jgi:Protein of unknown function (DUF669)
VKFTPKTDEELATENLLQPGDYDFEVSDAEETISKAGNSMIKMKVKVFDDLGSYRVVFDYLMESVAYKLKHAAKAVGLGDAYERGELEAYDFINRSGRCKINIQKDKSGQYPDKNGITDYLVDEATKTEARTVKRTPVGGRSGSRVADMDDEIPF